MTPRLDGRVVIVTGAGRGLGRAHALLLATEGALVVVNDLGGAADGSGEDLGPSRRVVEEIRAAGGTAIADGHDVSDWDGAQALVKSALDRFGRLDVVVNNAGILRDRMLFNMTPGEWDAVMRVHLRGTYATSRIAAAYWRDQHKKGGDVDARIINTSSASGLYGQQGQSNYGAAKAGIAAFTVIAAMELERFGITVNAVAPAAVTRLTDKLMPDEQKDWTADFVSPIVVWLASAASREVTGRVFNSGGGHLSIAESWHTGPEAEKDGMWQLDELDHVVPELVAQAASQPDMTGRIPAADAAE
jgi:NAD(P)-dependent dehydrogenase (short-subunit alcohol dehydrogenase family)